jgi:hypothetical protein
MREDDERGPQWPEPREDPDEEPSHPGARLEELAEMERERLTDGTET